MTVISHQQRIASLLGLGLLLTGVALIILGACVGSTGFESVGRAWSDPMSLLIVRDVRLPRTVGAWLAGALLGMAGAVAQGLFRNPLADPYLLGSASGASLGVALVLVLFGVSPFAAQWLVRLGLTGAAFVGAVGAVLLTLALAKGVQHTLRLLLAGVALGQTVLSRAVLAAGLDWDRDSAHSAAYDAERTADLFCTICNQFQPIYSAASNRLRNLGSLPFEPLNPMVEPTAMEDDEA